MNFRPSFRRPRATATTLMASAMAVLLALPAAAQPKAPPEWIQKSNAHAQVLLDLFARQSPEGAGQFGIAGLDEQISDLSAGLYERQTAAGEAARAELKKRHAAEEDPRVKQDLEILLDQIDKGRESSEVNRDLVLPYFSITSTVYQGLKALLDDRVPAERRQAAVVRMNKYAGLEKGYEPIAVLAEARIRERMNMGLLPPVRAAVERDLANNQTFVEGIEELCRKYDIKGYKKPYQALKKQLAAYDAFVRKEILPGARTDFRQPEQLYQLALRNYGNRMPVPELMSRARVSFREIQTQMQVMAPLVAKQRGWDVSDYRDVIRELKKEQVTGEAILPLYQNRLKEIEEIIRREHIVSLPARNAIIELSSAAEAAAIPAPHMSPPRLIGNTGEMGKFILPLTAPDPSGKAQSFDDFTFEAASWTLTAHEARPGHELQFASMIENGVSLARGVFSFNSVNIEGWGLYAEAELMPYEPVDGQLIALQHRLMRAARAFLDPSLQLGLMTPEEATRVLRDDVVLSEPMARQEVERYTFRAPGQAPSYFVGYCQLLEMRTKAEIALGKAFDRKKFNDFLLAQGMLPVELLEKVVMEEFVPAQLAVK
jgi:uncharacterized protein (DUF885 family)